MALIILCLGSSFEGSKTNHIINLILIKYYLTPKVAHNKFSCQDSSNSKSFPADAARASQSFLNLWQRISFSSLQKDIDHDNMMFCGRKDSLQLFVLALAAGQSFGIFNDEDYLDQKWVFDMINIYPAWEAGFFGKGVRVRVNDAGVDSEHEEFRDRFDVDASCEIFDAKYTDETGSTAYSQHGTTVASIIGASGNNGQCAVGVAPEVTISSCRIFELDTYLDTNLQSFDISQNSYGWPGCDGELAYDEGRVFGSFPDTSVCPFKFRSEIVIDGEVIDTAHPCDACTFPSIENSKICSDAVKYHCSYFFEEDESACVDSLEMLVEYGECYFQGTSDYVKESIEKGAKEGRNGLGIIFVFSSGNNFGEGGNTNYKALLWDRHIIAVGSVAQDGLRARYSDGGASLFVTAPGGDFEYVTNHMIATAGGGCKTSGEGTSYSSPVVTGVIALMLEANPQLSWRDVQHIIVKTSTPITHTPTDDTSQVINGAGFWHSDMVGLKCLTQCLFCPISYILQFTFDVFYSVWIWHDQRRCCRRRGAEMGLIWRRSVAYSRK